MNGAELARVCGVSKQAIAAATKHGRLHRDPTTRKYDPRHKLNSAFIFAKRAEGHHQDEEAVPEAPQGEMSPDMAELYERKLAAEVRRTEAMARKYELEVATRKQDLIPAELMGIYLGHFASGIRTNFLTLGNRIARGDANLRDRIEKEITKAIKKTIAGAAAGLRRDAAPIVAALKEHDDVQATD